MQECTVSEIINFAYYKLQSIKYSMCFPQFFLLPKQDKDDKVIVIDFIG